MDGDYNLRFPIGEAALPDKFDAGLVKLDIDRIAAFPADLISVVRSAGNEKLQHTYRPDGWTALQVIHHVVDSHINSYCRFKLALTENNPTIKPYEEQEWALLSDYDESMLDSSLHLLESLHVKWVYLMRNLTELQWNRTFFHPGSGKRVPLFQNAAIYAWHGKHHLRHIEIAVGNAKSESK